ncbi:hypothetical protein AB3S75_015337 [Citrus x aurantiifolia]
MAFFASQTSTVAAILTLIIFLYTLLLFVSRNFASNKKKRGPPEAGGAWPVIGHLHLLGRFPLHRVLGDMADKYGPIFTIRMGVHQALVVSNWEMAKECLTTHDRVFASRPKALVAEILGFNFSMFGFSPYGPHWRQIRKIATLELLSNHRLEKLKHVREGEVKTCLKELYEFWERTNNYKSSDHNNKKKVLVEINKWFEDVTLNAILRVTVGQRCNSSSSQEDTDHEGAWKEELTKFFAFSGKFVVSDSLPFLRWFDIGGDERAMKKNARELDVLAQGWLDEHKRKRESGQMINKEGHEDFMDVMLSILRDDAQQLPGDDADTINKATCLALILAASDTSKITLTWILSLLLNHRDVLKKAQNELDVHIGKGRQVNELDIKNLVYLQAIIKEAMRLYPAGPLAAPHASTEDCTVNDYFVPAGTVLYVNVWKIHRDPRVWPEPYKFKPERFLTTHKHIDVRGQNFELLPFSSGRRMCPGPAFAIPVTHLTLATLLHGFDFETPLDEPVDMSEGMSLTLVKTTPVKVLITPRLSASLYG